MRLRSAMCAAGLAIALAGCQTLNDIGSSITSSDKREAPQPPAPATTDAPAAPAAGSARVASGSGFAGMSAEALRSAWGEPTLKRNDTGAELWQYGSSSCTLLVYLYPDTANTMTVSRAEAVPGGADENAVTACAKAAGKPPLKPIS
jgi:hypothetical protein